MKIHTSGSLCRVKIEKCELTTQNEKKVILISRLYDVIQRFINDGFHEFIVSIGDELENLHRDYSLFEIDTIIHTIKECRGMIPKDVSLEVHLYLNLCDESSRSMVAMNYLTYMKFYADKITAIVPILEVSGEIRHHTGRIIDPKDFVNPNNLYVIFNLSSGWDEKLNNDDILRMIRYLKPVDYSFVSLDKTVSKAELESKSREVHLLQLL